MTTNGHQDYRRQVRVNTAVLRAHLAEAQRVFRLLEADAVMALAELDLKGAQTRVHAAAW